MRIPFALTMIALAALAIALIITAPAHEPPQAITAIQELDTPEKTEPGTPGDTAVASPEPGPLPQPKPAAAAPERTEPVTQLHPATRRVLGTDMETLIRNANQFYKEQIPQRTE